METREVRRQNFKLLADGFERKKDLAAKLGKAPSQVSQWLSGYRSIDEDSAREIERAMRKPVHWMDAIQVDTHPVLNEVTPSHLSSHRGGMAQVLSHPAVRVAPTVTWEQLKMKPQELPAEFHAVLPDDAMAPRAPAGVKVKFNRLKSPQPGDAVLVAGPDGEPYFREYRLRLGGWEAHATNPAYPSLQSDVHQLQVLAVFTGIDTSWAALAR